MPTLRAVRFLARSPRVVLAPTVMLALGVGAMTTVYALGHGALVRQPPFQDAARVTLLFLERAPAGEAPRRERWSWARYRLLEDQQRSFEAVASYSPASLTLSGVGEDAAEIVMGERVAPAYFGILGATPRLGRLFGPAESDPAQPAPVAVLSERLWVRRFARDTAVIGRGIRLNGVPLTVIGVLRGPFHGLSDRADVWVPAALSPRITYPEYLTTNQNFISVAGRLREGTSLTAAQAELAVLGQRINAALPSDPDHPGERVVASAVPINRARVEPTVRRSVLLLLGGVALLHLLACANVVNLRLGHVAARRRDAALRMALGSSAPREFRQLVVEGVALAAPGGALGLLLAWLVGVSVVPPSNAWAPVNFYGSLAAFDAPALSGPVLLVGLALVATTTLVVAIVPALTAFRFESASGLRPGARGVAEGAVSLRRPTGRGLVLVVEAALAMLLVVTAGLLIVSFDRMRRAPIGVEPAGVLSFWLIPSEARVTTPAAPAFVSRVLDAVRRVPGVLSASVDGGSPLSGSATATLFREGEPAPGPGQAPPVLRHYVGPDHFRTLGIPLIRGRVFTEADDASAPRVTVISATAASRFWPGQDPLGRRVWFGGGSDFDAPERSAEIIGVVGDVVYRPLDRDPNLASFYTPYRQFTFPARMVFLRTAGDPLAVVPAVRQAVASVDPDLALSEVEPLADVVRGSWARHRFDAILFGGFGLVALLLASSGIFAVLSHAVATRTREFGIRIALGATRARLLRQVVREGMVFPVIGLLLGLGAALAAAEVLRSSLYEISPAEPRVLLSMTALLLVVSAAASLAPAWRATRADPVEALRSES